MAILVILGLWLVVSVPTSLAVGLLLRPRVVSFDEPELVGVHGGVAVFYDDGALVRVPMRAAAGSNSTR